MSVIIAQPCSASLSDLGAELVTLGNSSVSLIAYRVAVEQAVAGEAF